MTSLNTLQIILLSIQLCIIAIFIIVGLQELVSQTQPCLTENVIIKVHIWLWVLLQVGHCYESDIYTELQSHNFGFCQTVSQFTKWETHYNNYSLVFLLSSLAIVLITLLLIMPSAQQASHYHNASILGTV